LNEGDGYHNITYRMKHMKKFDVLKMKMIFDCKKKYEKKWMK